MVIEWTGEWLLMVEDIYSPSCYIHGYAKVVQHVAHRADQRRLAAKHVGKATEQSIGAGSQPEAEQRVVVGVREVMIVREVVEPGQPEEKGEEMSPEVAEVIVSDTSISHTLSKGRVRFAIAINDVWLPVYGSNLVTMVC